MLADGQPDELRASGNHARPGRVRRSEDRLQAWPDVELARDPQLREYDYTASEKEPFGDLTNDKACASIPICIPGRDRACTPPETKEVDLTIRKRADTPICSLDGVCLFIIDIINSGDQAINGPLTVIDTYPAGVPASSDFEPTPPWACMPTGVGQFRCDHPGIMLVPGAGTSITVKTVVGPDFRADEIENCAEVQPVPGETDLTNNKACAKARVPHRQPGQPALRITKTCEAVAGSAGYTCRITVINLGTVAPSGPVRVGDAAEIIGTGTPVQIQTVTPDGAEWTCGPVPADTLSCQIPGNLLTPGTSRHFDVGLTVSPNQRFENCARGSYGPAPGDDIVYPFGEACDQGGAAIKVEKTGDHECRTGEPCTFLITIGNDSDEPFSGPVRIGDAIELDGIGRLEGVPISSINPPFGCSPEPATLPISCDANLSLGAGESRVHRVTIVIPDDALANRTDPVSGRNCVAVLEPGTSVRGGGVTIGRVPAGGVEADRRYACHMFRLSKEEVKECSRGFVLNDAGRCVCPEGTTFRNGQCTGGGTPPPPTPPEPEPEQCTLLPGQIRTSDGRCICRAERNCVVSAASASRLSSAGCCPVRSGPAMAAASARAARSCAVSAASAIRPSSADCCPVRSGPAMAAASARAERNCVVSAASASRLSSVGCCPVRSGPAMATASARVERNCEVSAASAIRPSSADCCPARSGPATAAASARAAPPWFGANAGKGRSSARRVRCSSVGAAWSRSTRSAAAARCCETDDASTSTSRVAHAERSADRRIAVRSGRKIPRCRSIRTL